MRVRVAFSTRRPDRKAGIAQLVERNLAKVEVASSNLVARSIFSRSPGRWSETKLRSRWHHAAQAGTARWQSGYAADCNSVWVASNATPRGNFLWVDDFTVTITDANEQPYTPEILGVYRVFPDQTSQYAVQSQNRSDPNFGKLTPHDGAVWLAIRLTSNLTTALPLAPGDATISVSSPKLTQTLMTHDGDYSNIPIYIVDPPPGQEAPVYPLQSQSSYAYGTQGYLTLKPSGAFSETVGGAQINIEFDCTLTQQDSFQLRLVPLHSNPHVNLIQSVTPADPSNCPGPGKQGTLTAMVTNVDGIAPGLPSWSQGQGTPEDLQLAIVSDSGGVAGVANASLDTKFTWDGYYIDMNGDTINGITPVLSNELF